MLCRIWLVVDQRLFLGLCFLSHFLPCSTTAIVGIILIPFRFALILFTVSFTAVCSPWNLNFVFASVVSVTLRVFLSRIGSEQMSWSWGILGEPASDLTLALGHGTSSLRWDVCEHNHLEWREIPFSSRNCVHPRRQKTLRVTGTTEANMKFKIHGLQTAMKDTVVVICSLKRTVEVVRSKPLVLFKLSAGSNLRSGQSFNGARSHLRLRGTYY